MKKIFLALAAATLSGNLMAESMETPVKSEYRIFTGYSKTTIKTGDIKDKANGPQIGARADIPFDEHHGMRVELSHAQSKLKSTDTAENAEYVSGAKLKDTNAYVGYTYTQQAGKNTRFRGGLGVGYDKLSDNKGSHAKEGAQAFNTSRESVYLKAHAEVEQQLGNGWSLTPWGEVTADLHAKTKASTTQIGASRDVSENTKGWGLGLGLNVGKQITDSVGIEFGPYYKHHKYGESDTIVLDGEETFINKAKVNEFGFRVGAKF